MNNINLGPFYSIDDIIRANERAGCYFFERGAMSGFRSRLCQDIYPTDGYNSTGHGAYFVTSEQFTDGRGYVAARRYTVRHAAPNGKIDTVGKFQAYATRYQAKKEAQRLSLLDHA